MIKQIINFFENLFKKDRSKKIIKEFIIKYVELIVDYILFYNKKKSNY